MNIKRYNSRLIVIDNKIISYETHVGNILSNENIEIFKYYSRTTNRDLNNFFGGYYNFVTNNKTYYNKNKYNVNFKLNCLVQYEIIEKKYSDRLRSIFNTNGKNERKLVLKAIKEIENGEEFNKRFK
jgi:hypothetical protein